MAYYGAIPVRSGIHHTIGEAGFVSVRNNNGFAARKVFLFRDPKHGDGQLLMNALTGNELSSSGYATYQASEIRSSRSGSIGVEKSLQLYKRTRS